MKIFEIDECRGCKRPATALIPWFSLPAQPPANAFVPAEQVKVREKFPLDLVYCPNCELIQLKHVVDPDILFQNYTYLSSTSQTFKNHFKQMASDCFLQKIVKKDDLVIDIGSNDGILLSPFKALGARVLGVEPAENIAKIAEENGIPTICEYFTRETAGKILEEHGHATLITMTNVFAHIHDTDQILDAVKYLLDDTDGQLLIEFPNTMQMIKDGTFDLVYHEHLSYFTVPSIVNYLSRMGFFVEEISQVPVHGGSLRVLASLASERQDINCSPRVKGWYYEVAGFTKTKQFHAFPKKIEEHKRQTLKLLKKLEYNIIFGYGAPAKMSTLTNSYGIGQRTITGIIDDSPAKQNTVSPGQEIEIVPCPARFDGVSGRIDYMFIFAWNFKDDIIKNLQNRGYKGDFIIPFPLPRILKGKDA